jgi:hypothetical protein
MVIQMATGIPAADLTSTTHLAAEAISFLNITLLVPALEYTILTCYLASSINFMKIEHSVVELFVVEVGRLLHLLKLAYVTASYYSSIY